MSRFNLKAVKQTTRSALGQCVTTLQGVCRNGAADQSSGVMNPQRDETETQI